MDHAGEILFEAREQTMLATCDASMLQSHADDRSIVDIRENRREFTEKGSLIILRYAGWVELIKE